MQKLMRKFIGFIIALMMTMSMTSCVPAAMAADVSTDTAVVTTVSGTAYTFYWLFDNGYYYRRPCQVYYAARPYYWGGPRSYYHCGWRPLPNTKRHYGPPRNIPHNRPSYRPNHSRPSHNGMHGGYHSPSRPNMNHSNHGHRR